MANPVISGEERLKRIKKQQSEKPGKAAGEKPVKRPVVKVSKAKKK